MNSMPKQCEPIDELLNAHVALSPRPSMYYKFRPYSAEPARSWVRQALFENRV